MSMKVLEALVGADRVAEMPSDDVHRLCDAIDAEILKDDSLQARLLEAVTAASDTLGKRDTTS